MQFFKFSYHSADLVVVRSHSKGNRSKYFICNPYIRVLRCLCICLSMSLPMFPSSSKSAEQILLKFLGDIPFVPGIGLGKTNFAFKRSCSRKVVSTVVIKI